MASDLTNDLLWSLQNEPQKWKRSEGIAVFRAHERKVQDDQTIKVTDRDLDRIANEANEGIKKSGKLPTFTLGHRRFGQVDEKKQPELIGFYQNFRAETVVRNGESFRALVADEYAAVDKASEFEIYRRYPFRSGEYHPELGFTGVAALQQEPWLKLGTNIEYRADQPPTCYQSEAIPMADQLNQQPGGDDVDEGMYAAWMKCMAKYMATAGQGGAGAAVGAANAAPPAKANPAQYQADNVVDQKVKDLQATVDTLKRENTVQKCKQLLQPLVNVYQFDQEREISQMMTYQTDEQLAQHVDYIVKNYAQLPGGQMIQVYQGQVVPQGIGVGKPDDSPFAPPANFGNVTAYMLARPGMSYDQAELELRAQTKA